MLAFADGEPTSWCARRSSSRGSTSRTPTRSSSTAPTRSGWRSSTSSAAAWAGRAGPTPTCCTGARAAVGRGAQAAPGDLQRVRAGRRVPDRALRPGDPRRGQHPGRRAVRPHGRGRLRPLLADARRGGRGGEGVREGARPIVEAPQAVIDLPVDAYLPDDYVPEEAQKLELYRRLARARTPATSPRSARRSPTATARCPPGPAARRG